MEPRRRKLGTVAGPHPKTAAAGMAMLKAGGNAVDAAVATAFTEGVVKLLHNGVAGYGGCMLIYLAAKRKVVSIDFNSAAPAAASERMFRIEKTRSRAGYRMPGAWCPVLGAGCMVPGAGCLVPGAQCSIDQ